MYSKLITQCIIILFSVSVQISRSTTMSKSISNLSLFDFQSVTDLNNWTEKSDTVRTAGRSKATFDLYKTSVKQSAIFFAMLNPLPNGACFAGVRTPTQFNLFGYHYLHFTCKATGNISVFKIVLRHNNLDNEPHPTFEQKFKVNNDSETIVNLPISEFKPYFRGKIIDNGPILNVRNISNFGIQVAGGVYEDFKQSGLVSIVIDQIWAVPHPIETRK